MKKILGIILAMFLLNSCYAFKVVPTDVWLTPKYLDHTYQEIIDMHGVPNRIIPDGSGGQILIYEEYHAITSVGNTLSVSSFTRGDYIEAFINEKGVCYDVRTNKVERDIDFEKSFLLNAVWVVPLIVLTILATVSNA